MVKALQAIAVTHDRRTHHVTRPSAAFNRNLPMEQVEQVVHLKER